eukprot:Nk52_evm27s62 gene=Nk52_evmTU27s62
MSSIGVVVLCVLFLFTAQVTTAKPASGESKSFSTFHSSSSGRGTAKSVFDDNAQLEYIHMRNPHTNQEAKVYLRGAQVFSWTGDTRQGKNEEHIWQNKQLKPYKTSPYQGGIPIVFPQFADFGPVSFHGFAQVTLFELLWSKSNENGEITISLGMKNKDVKVEDKKLVADPSNIYTDPFEFEYIITLDNDYGLNSTMRVANVADDQDFKFTTAFHNYLQVSDIDNVRVGQLEGLSYADRMNNQKMVLGEMEFPTPYGKPIHEHTDRVYTNTPQHTNITVFNNAKVDANDIQKVISIERYGFNTRLLIMVLVKNEEHQRSETSEMKQNFQNNRPGQVIFFIGKQ